MQDRIQVRPIRVSTCRVTDLHLDSTFEGSSNAYVEEHDRILGAHLACLSIKSKLKTQSTKARFMKYGMNEKAEVPQPPTGGGTWISSCSSIFWTLDLSVPNLSHQTSDDVRSVRRSKHGGWRVARSSATAASDIIVERSRGTHWHTQQTTASHITHHTAVAKIVAPHKT
jgi:hypothetical protein